MARPRTFAAPVAFRLPPDYQEKLEYRALRSGKPLAVYVRETLMEVLDNGHKPVKKPAAKRAPVKKAAADPKPKPARGGGKQRTTRATTVNA